mgnify:CR=1 FL=1
MKRIISAILAVAMAVTMLVIPANAAKSTVKVWNGKVVTSWYTGDKTEYNISSPGQLAGLAKLVNSGESMQGVVINLTADLKMNNTKDWKKWYETAPKNKFTPIGKTGDPIGGYYPFAGVFNGNGHSISGLYVNNPEVAGLFGYIYCAAVSNVIIKESVIIAYDNEKNDGAYAGSIAGIAEGSIINKCENTGEVRCIGQKDAECGWRTAYAGGIVGSMHTENVSSVALGVFMAAGGVFANPYIFTDGSGGLIKDSCVANCISGGLIYTMSGVEAYSGGIAGWGNNGTIMNCLATNSFKWNKGRGGLGNLKLGGIAGGRYSCSVDNCYYYAEKKFYAVGEDTSSSVVPVKGKAYFCTKEQIRSKELAEKLGTAFKYVKDNRPYLTCDLRIANK